MKHVIYGIPIDFRDSLTGSTINFLKIELNIIFYLQHYLTMVGGIISVPFLLSGPLCIHEDDPTRGYLISTIFMVSGIATFLQSSLGVR